MFILNADLEDVDVAVAFARYHAYVEEHAARLPTTVVSLVRDGWYFWPPDHRCPHDAWLLSVAVDVGGVAHSKPTRDLTLRLLGAYHDLILTFRYLDVGSFDLSMFGSSRPLDFHRDEFTVGPVGSEGRFVHTIEWLDGNTGPATWRIEARDLQFSVEPVAKDAAEGESNDGR